MTNCPNCQSDRGTEKEGIWHCKVCNGEHKISLKPQAPEEAHATTASPSTTTGSGEIPSKSKSAPSQHEASERATTGNSSADSE